MPTALEQKSEPNASRESKRRKRLLVLMATCGAVIVLGLICVAIFSKPAKPIQMPLGDGRILQVEGVTYGIQHQMGNSSWLERFRPWLPDKLKTFFRMDRAANTITLDRPGLVVWVDAISAVTPTNVDCQGIRVELVDRNGDTFGAATSSWFGGASFWRVGHIFYCYPRDERELTLQVTTWRRGKTTGTRILNPKVFPCADWSGKPLPQSTNTGGLEISLTALVTRTNGGKKRYWEAPATYFEPVWVCRLNGKPAVGWEKAEWFAEDPRGNRGKFLGAHQPTLRFFAVAYPEATNMQAALLIATLPQTDLTTSTTNLWWNQTNSFGSNQLTVLGLFLPGTHTFSDGKYESSTTAVLGPGGGARSGWTGRSQRISPMRVKETHSHYTPSPVLYIQVVHQEKDPSMLDHLVQALPGAERLAVRLRDDHGQYWIANPEDDMEGIHPFLIELPPGVTNVVPEAVRLKPARADFLVETKSYLKSGSP